MPVAALVLGIIGLLCAFLPGFGTAITFISCLLAIIFGVIGRRGAVENKQPTGMATAGMVLGIVGMILGVGMYLACAACVAGTGAMLQ